MINIIKSILNNIIKDIDAGNSNITEEDEAKIQEIRQLIISVNRV